MRVERIWLMAPSTRQRATKPATGARRRWLSVILTAAGTSSPAAYRRLSACVTSTVTRAPTTTQLPLAQVAPCKSSRLTARSATPRIGTTSSGLADQLSLLPTYCITPDNALIPLAGGLCAGRLTRSHLLAARSILTLAKRGVTAPVQAQAPAGRLEEGSGEGSSPRRAAHYHVVLACYPTAEHRRGDQDGA